MVAVRPVAAWVVEPSFATDVVGPAYDALGSAERRALAEGNEDSFFNVLRSPVDFVDDDGAEELLAANAAALERLLGTGRYRPPHREQAVPLRPAVGEPRADRSGRRRAGAARCSTAPSGPTSATRSAKEAELAGHLRHLRMQSSPVGLTYRADPAIDALVEPRHGRRQRWWSSSPSTASSTACGRFPAG